jgi:SpoVK/Ycf46/Vps4 family AAA+-type ATPase
LEQFIKDNIGWLGLGTVGLSSIAMGGWRYVRGLWLNTWRKLFLVITMNDNWTIQEAILVNLMTNYKKFEFGKINLLARHVNVKGERKLILAEELKKTIIFYKNFRVIVYSDSFRGSGQDRTHTLDIITLRFGFDLKKFVLDSYKQLQKFKRLHKSYSVVTLQGDLFSSGGNNSEKVIRSEEDISEDIDDLTWCYRNKPYNIDRKELLEIDGDPFKGLFLNRNVEDILDKVNTWYESKDFYIERKIPWKLSFLLHGVGGTGKSSIVSRIAQKYRMNLYKFDLSTFSNRSFVKKWENILTNSNLNPCIVLFEDFDNTFYKRENISNANKSAFDDSLTFDCLLNCLSGVTPNNGILLFITTNNIDAIDEAIGVYDKKKKMSTRPGRIDYIYEFTYMEDIPRRNMIHFMLHGLELDLDAIFRKTKGMTGVQLQKYCSEIGSNRLKELKIEGIKK